MTLASYGGFLEEHDNPILRIPPLPFGNPDSSLVASGRTALDCLANSLKIKTLYVPSFLCEEVIKLVALAGVEIKSYELGGHSYWRQTNRLKQLVLGKDEF